MSWYSKIYTKVREIRRRRPLVGWVCTKLLNTLLIIQILGLSYSTYVYIFITIGYYVQSSIQASMYMCMATLLLTMSLWSLTRALIEPVARVPTKYRPSAELDAQLRKVTPNENGRFSVEKSSPQQIAQQNEVLEAMCKQRGVVVAECDQLGRIKYCYECAHIKPDRARHCSSCGECVVKFDHHCPWINKCVSHANYKFFLLYVLYTTCFLIWYLLTSVESVLRYFTLQRWLSDLAKLLQVLFTMTTSAVFGLAASVNELLIFHWEILSLNETTCEQTKPAVLRFDNRADYNQGRLENFRQVFGWGLWLFPIATSTDDGLHYEIRYESTNNKNRFVRIELQEQGTKSLTDSPSSSLKIDELAAAAVVTASKLKRRSIQQLATTPAAPLRLSSLSAVKKATVSRAPLPPPVLTATRSRLTNTINAPPKTALVQRNINVARPAKVDPQKKYLELEAKLVSKSSEFENISQLLQVMQNTMSMMENEISMNKVKIECLSRSAVEQQKILSEKIDTIEALTKVNLEQERELRKLHNEVVDLKGQIRVSLRVRPMLSAENNLASTLLSFSTPNFIKIDQGKTELSYEFEHVFPPQCSQLRIFESMQDLILSVLHGYNVSLIAFGQTGSGKTHTMRGGDGQLAGIIPRAVNFILGSLEKMTTAGWKFTLGVSYVEVYNNDCYDLLNKRMKLAIKPTNGVVVLSDLRVREIDSTEEIEEVLALADAFRSTASTKCNEFSSRSHAIFQLNVATTHEQSGVSTNAILKLVDLAGSERAKESEATGDRFKEMVAINQSLSCLQNCIRQQRLKQKHVPYRESTLTMLLRDCLGAGNSKTMVIVNVNPLDAQSAETKRSIEFANKMRTTKIGVAAKHDESVQRS